MSHPINIHEHVRAICDALGLDANNVARLDIKPHEVEATVYMLNENGKKYATEQSIVPVHIEAFPVIA